jgi:glycosyltransferase involved in cell wall biosynthesis
MTDPHSSPAPADEPTGDGDSSAPDPGDTGPPAAAAPASHPSPSSGADPGPLDVGIVIPVYNEASFIREAMASITAELTGIDATIHIYLVENGSSDATGEIAADLASDPAITAIRISAANYGLAMREGFRAAADAGAAWVVNFDIDYFSGQFVGDLVGGTGAGADIVIASKRDPGSDDRRTPTRRLATLVFNLLLRFALGSRVSDTHGIKGFRAGVIRATLDTVVSNEDLFDTELVVRAERAGFVIREVPIVVEELREARSSLLKRVPRTLRGIARVRRALARESA